MDVFTGVQRAISEDEDFYKLLGCDETSTEEQITTEFKILARKWHPDKITDEEEKAIAEKRFMLLEKARKVLLDKDMRSKFDQWRNGGFCKWVSFEDWLSIHSRVHTSIHWASTQQKRPSIQGGESGGDTKSASSSDEQNEVKMTKTEPDSLKTEAPMSLEEFRRSSEQTTLLSRFRHYKV